MHWPHDIKKMENIEREKHPPEFTGDQSKPFR